MKMLKKKGFTLIELIAVIAILAILGVILVPKIAGYTASASKSKDLTNAKQIIQAVELYNADNQSSTIGTTEEGYTIDVTTDGIDATNSKVGLKKYLSAFPKEPVTTLPVGHKTWGTMTITELRAYEATLE